ncbi:hypothetical protein [Clostridium sp.]|uniref:hypothetical protein n=1 Tax=Clostridium sp. TaxID=1506 RepID=UPI002842B3E6|nr:hypothetical protein [Clostridium sp.]MDR3596985.1 hypothetical protein [Clostridium sp.]
MKEKIIYVDFLKKRRVTFVHFIISKIITLIFVKLNVRTKNSQNIDVYKSKRISR